MILPTFTQFRWHCARRKTIDPSPDTVTFDLSLIRLSGSTTWAENGLEPGMTMVASGSSSNDGRRYVAETLDGVNANLDDSSAAVSESGATCTFLAWHEDPDGLPRWPGPFDSTNLVRANGFDGGISGLANVGYEGDAIEVTVDAGPADSVKGTPDYTWYLSQRTDDAAKQYLALTTKPDDASNSYSSTVNLVHTAQAATVLGISSGVVTVDAFVRLFRRCSLYVRRNSDGAIQWLPLLQTMMP